MDRRRFLSTLGGGAVGFAGAYYMYRLLSPGPGVARVDVRDYLRYGSDAALKAITPNDDFYITSKGLTPAVDVHGWRLTIDGLVEKPLSLTYPEVRGLAALERTLTLECISNPIGGPWIGNANWRGTSLRALLERARPRAAARAALLHAADGFSTGIPLERLTREENLLVYEMNGQPLPLGHGYPLRVFFPGKYGMKQPKWLTRIELVEKQELGYWEKRGWSDTAERRTHTVIDFPADKSRLAAGELLVVGYALTDASGIQRVETSFDDGQTWQAAEIFSNPSPFVWTFWRQPWKPAGAGTYHLLARAVNGRGELQIEEESGPGPEGATGWQRVGVTLAPGGPAG